jgi:hypothetical protein
MRRLVSTLTLAVAFLFLTTNSYAVIPTHTAYLNLAIGGNQAFTGNLGLNFTVNSPGIVVTALGAFNSTRMTWAAGTEITVGIFNSAGTVPIVSAVFDATTPGTLVGSPATDRFLTITPTFLPPGNYIVVAQGFNATDMNGNQTIAPNPSSSEDNSGLITFTAPAAYDSNTTLDNPTPSGCSACDMATNEFEAGTFQFQQAMPPTITKSFSPTTSPKVLQAGLIAGLTFSLTSPNTPLTGLTFTDTLPSGLALNDSTVTGTCDGGTITANTMNNTITLTGASLAAGASCTFSVDVTSQFPGAYQNTTGSVTDDQMLTGMAGTDTLNVMGSLTFSKKFSDSEIQLLGIGTWLNFIITNPTTNPITATGIAFTDTFPAGLIVANDTGITVKGSCGGGTITANPGSNTITMTGALLAVGATCKFSVAVFADPNSPSPSLGTLTNTSSSIFAFPIPMSMPVTYALVSGNAYASVDVNFLEFLWFFLAGKG